MEDNTIYRSALAMAEDIRLIRKGGGPLVDDDNLSERQVLYWIALACADMVREASKQPVVDERLWKQITATTSLTADGCAWVSTTSLANVATRYGKPLVRNVMSGYHLLEERSTQQLAGQTKGFGRFAAPVGVFNVSGLSIKVAMPLEWEEASSVQFDAVVIPNSSEIIDNPLNPLPVPDDWHMAIRQQVMINLQPISAGAPDQVNNGTDRQRDKR